MLFCTGEYVLFFSAVLGLYWATPSARVRVWLLLAASFGFYAAWNKWLALLVLGSSAVDYAVALAMEGARRQGARKLLLGGSLVMNLGLLCYFKYANFFLDSLSDTLHALGAGYTFPTLSVLLPVGISFYTFEAINYAVDVYRRKAPAERRLDHFLLFILFFPHLVAGPIVRARDFLPQIKRPKRWSWSRAGLGLMLLALGAFKKLAIADRMAQFADPVFADAGRYSTGASWVAAVAFALQLYCDFSGYSDMALGSAHLLGYKLVVNFRLPFLAPNVSEFWRRWHISLSTWLRDYLFIPLGGSRGGIRRTSRNLLVTMTVGGLWHGANWPFVVWGFLQGVLLVGHRALVRLLAPFARTRAALESTPGTAGRVAITFALFCITMTAFRSPSLHTWWVMLAHMFVPTPGLPAPLFLHGFWATLVLVAVGHLAGWRLTQSPFVWRRVYTSTPAPALGMAGAAAVVLAVVLRPGATKAFIYFQF